MTPQKINSAYLANCEQVIEQLSNAIKDTKFSYNSWSGIYAEDVNRHLDLCLVTLRELTNVIRKEEAANEAA